MSVREVFEDIVDGRANLLGLVVIWDELLDIVVDPWAVEGSNRGPGCALGGDRVLKAGRDRLGARGRGMAGPVFEGAVFEGARPDAAADVEAGAEAKAGAVEDSVAGS